MDAVVLIDSSDSIAPENFDLMRSKYLRALMKHFTIHEEVTRVAIMQFANSTEWLLRFRSVKRQSWTGITGIARNLRCTTTYTLSIARLIRD